MKKISILCLIIISLSISLYAQPEKAQKLMEMGIRSHDIGEYEKAIELYREALELAPDSPLLYYEIASSYMLLGEHKKALENAEIAEEKDTENEYTMPIIILKGSALDNLGKTQESIKLFEDGIEKYGGGHLLYYNLALTCFKIKNYTKAEEALINAIYKEPSHASSHLLLGFVMSDIHRKTKTVLALNYFLLLEPDTERSKTAFHVLNDQFNKTIKKKGSGDSTTITLYRNDSEDEFMPVETMSAFFALATFEEDSTKSMEEKFISGQKTVFQPLDNLMNEESDESREGFWWEFYPQLFVDIHDSPHFETYCYVIMQNSSETARKWLADNNDKLVEFIDWMKKR